MRSASTRRVVVVTHQTELQKLLSVHATLGQARFFLRSRGQELEAVQEQDALHRAALRSVTEAIPNEWRRVSCFRRDLERFLFEPNDIVLVVGRDGLVANVAKYLDGQLVIGVNPAPDRYTGVLVTSRPVDTRELLHLAVEERIDVEERTMVAAKLDGALELHALNELFIGHRSHQTARYELDVWGRRERQMSSGIIVSTGTGATGWALAINRELAQPLSLPSPVEGSLALFVREVFPTVSTGASLTRGLIGSGEQVTVTSRMDGDGVVFGDGIEVDHLDFGWGRRLTISVSKRRLKLVRGQR